MPQNSLLIALPEADWDALKPSLEPVSLKLGDVLARAGEPFDRLYFPIAGVVSTVALFENGSSAEMATVGTEGMVGMGAVLGANIALSRHVVQIPGRAWAVLPATFQRLRDECPAFRDVLSRYMQVFLIQVLQSVACNAVHSVHDRAARWLLTCDDRSGGEPFTLTQQFLSEMLGVSRPMVNTVARTLQRAGYIEYSRGIVTIVDRAGLENASCECYAIIRTAYQDRGITLSSSRTA